MPLIMVGQNLQNRHAEVRADAEYKTVGKMFHDTEAVMKHLDLQDAELLRQTRLLTALVESLVPADQRAAILGGSGAGHARLGRLTGSRAPVGRRQESTCSA